MHGTIILEPQIPTDEQRTLGLGLYGAERWDEMGLSREEIAFAIAMMGVESGRPRP